MDQIIRFTDLKSLQEISKVIIIPMLISASIIQSKFSIFGISIDQNETVFQQTLQFLCIFAQYSLFIGTTAIAIHKILFLLQIFTNLTALYILSMLFLALAFLGVFGKSAPLLSQLDSMWFYTAFVCGFYFLSRASDIDRDIDNMTK